MGLEHLNWLSWMCCRYESIWGRSVLFWFWSSLTIDWCLYRGQESLRWFLAWYAFQLSCQNKLHSGYLYRKCFVCCYLEFSKIDHRGVYFSRVLLVKGFLGGWLLCSTVLPRKVTFHRMFHGLSHRIISLCILGHSSLFGGGDFQAVDEKHRGKW